jgi:hypothetical protein
MFATDKFKSIVIFVKSKLELLYTVILLLHVGLGMLLLDISKYSVDKEPTVVFIS